MAPSASVTRPDPVDPPAKQTDEAAPHHHRMAQQQGDAYKTAVTHMAEKVAMTGGEAHVGEMIVALALEPAEGMYEWDEGALQWVEPGDQNVHIEVSARDATDNRFIPGLKVHVRVLDEERPDEGRRHIADALAPMALSLRSQLHPPHGALGDSRDTDRCPRVPTTRREERQAVHR